MSETKTKPNGANAPVAQAQQEQAVAKSNGGPPACKVGGMGVQVDTLEAMWWLANRIFASNLCPTDCKRAEDVFIRVQMGMEIGLKPMQAVQNIATINGRPALWGPLVKGLVLASGLCDKWEEKWLGPDDGTFPDDFGHQVTTKRKGFDGEFTVTFTVRDAKKAGLWGKNVWASYPKDMIVGKTRARAAKGQFGDVLGGLAPADDATDPVYTEVEVVESQTNRHPDPRDLDAATDALAARTPKGTAERIREEVARETAKPEAEPEPDPETGEIPDEAEEGDIAEVHGGDLW